MIYPKWRNRSAGYAVVLLVTVLLATALLTGCAYTVPTTMLHNPIPDQKQRMELADSNLFNPAPITEPNRLDLKNWIASDSAGLGVVKDGLDGLPPGLEDSIPPGLATLNPRDASLRWRLTRSYMPEITTLYLNNGAVIEPDGYLVEGNFLYTMNVRPDKERFDVYRYHLGQVDSLEIKTPTPFYSDAPWIAATVLGMLMEGVIFGQFKAIL